MRLALAALLVAVSVAAIAAPNPVTIPTKLDPAWQAQTRSLFKEIVEIPSVKGRGKVPAVASAIAARLTAAGIPANDIKLFPYTASAGDETQAMAVRWRSAKPTKKPILILGHMDVVEAKREDWKLDPFTFVEKDGYFYGRGTADMKNGLVGATMGLLKLKASGFKPDRDIILFFTGDEETMGKGATLGASEWRAFTDAEFGLNADGGAGAFRADGRPLGFGVSTSEKTFQTYFLTTHNRGGHSSKPRPDNAIYELADALKAVQNHRFTPVMTSTTRSYFTARAKQEPGPLGDAMRRWLANPADGAAADAIEASELEVGLTRTRCVATMLDAGHADNALPQTARATVNCRIMPGVEPKLIQAELQQAVGPKVEVAADPNYIGEPTPESPLRPDVFTAFGHAVHAIHGPDVEIRAVMQTGASDGSFFRAKGIPVRAMYDDVLHWEMMLRELSRP